jgi:hypothetical protein
MIKVAIVTQRLKEGKIRERSKKRDNAKRAGNESDSR